CAMRGTDSSETLELHEPEGAFNRIEDWLRERGFFSEGAEELAADLYLGYGLSQPVRRNASPPPPEPCPLPLAACSVRRGSYSVHRTDNRGMRIGEWEATWSPDGYEAAIEDVRAAIARGDVYQVNLVQHLSTPFAGDPCALAAALAPLAPLH